MAALTAASTAFFSLVDKLESLSTYVIVGSAGLYLSVCSLYLITKVKFEETLPAASQALIVRVYSGFLLGPSPFTCKFSGTLPYALTRNGLAEVAFPGTLKLSREISNQGKFNA